MVLLVVLNYNYTKKTGAVDQENRNSKLEKWRS